MQGHLLALLLGAAPAAMPAPAPAPQAMHQISLMAAYDRCMTTYAVKLLESGLGDDDLYLVASTMCKGLLDEVKSRITGTLPPAEAGEFLRAIAVDPKGDYRKKLQAIREGRARREPSQPAAPPP
jgi:hypothetical protein